MRSFNPLPIGCLSIIFSCASLNHNQKSFSLSEVEQIQIGKESASSLRQRYGNPIKIVDLNPEEEIWTYNGYRYGEWCEQTTFKISKSLGTVLNAVWLPSDTDEYSNLKNVLLHFKESKFKIEKPKPLGDGHYYSDTSNYFSPETGITLAVNEKNQTVSAVSLSIPNRMQMAK